MPKLSVGNDTSCTRDINVILEIFKSITVCELFVKAFRELKSVEGVNGGDCEGEYF